MAMWEEAIVMLGEVGSPTRRDAGRRINVKENDVGVWVCRQNVDRQNFEQTKCRTDKMSTIFFFNFFFLKFFYAEKKCGRQFWNAIEREPVETSVGINN